MSNGEVNEESATLEERVSALESKLEAGVPSEDLPLYNNLSEATLQGTLMGTTSCLL